MDQAIQGFWDILSFFFGRPQTHFELMSMAVLCVETCTLVVSLVGGGLNVPSSGPFISLFVVVSALLLAISTAVVVRRYALSPYLRYDLRQWIVIGSAVAGFLVLGLPVHCIMQRTGYLSALMAWVPSLLAAAVLMVVVHTIVDATRAGGEVSEKARQHRATTEDLFK